MPAAAQAGKELYARNDLDRGHLVRRMDPVWGPRDAAEQANRDTFMFTNAAPQVARFNQSKELWKGLEDYVLEHAETYAQRLSVFTGPLLAPDDPVYRGVQLPRRFWKVAAWATDEPGRPRLAATGYLLEQTIKVDELDTPSATPSGAPGLGAFRTFQVTVVDLATLTGLDLGPLSEADVLPRPALRLPPAAARSGTAAPECWVLLRDTDTIQLGP